MTRVSLGSKVRLHWVWIALFFILISHTGLCDEKIPMELQDVGIEDHTGTNIDLNLNFTDETGTTVPLKKYFNNSKPVLFFLVYYGCPNLCTLVLNAGIDSLRGMDLTPGRQFEIVAVSIDPNEKPELAKDKKVAYLETYGRPGTENGWHFLVGHQPEIDKIAKQIGFKYKWDPEQKQFAHASAMYVLTPEGKISRYFYGIDYPSRDVKIALLEAGQGAVGSFVDKIILFCYHYDASTKKSVLWASRIMTLGGAVTLAILGLFMAGFWLKERSQIAEPKG